MSGISRRLLSGITLIHIGNLHVFSSRCLNGFGKLTNLRPILLIGRRHLQRQQMPQSIHCGMNLQESIDCPAFHIEHMPSSFWPRAARPGVVVMEGRFAAKEREELVRRGHKVEVGEDWSEGRLCACASEKTPEGTILKAGANPRGMQNYAVGR